MGALKREVEWLRPLVKTKGWDYCVIWKLGNDPSRFVEWMDCCCAGGNDCYIAVKEEIAVEAEKHLRPLCRDAHFQHPLRTKACETLAQYPSSMPLYSGYILLSLYMYIYVCVRACLCVLFFSSGLYLGLQDKIICPNKSRIHGEVVISNQPRWLSHETTSNSNYEPAGTQVIIPVDGGLIELFSTKNVPKDQKLIEFITAHFNVCVEQEIRTAPGHTNISLEEKPHDHLFYYEHLNNQYHLNSIPRLQNIVPVSQSSPYCIEGSSTSSTPSNENPSLKSVSSHVSPNVSPNKSIGNSSGSWKLNCHVELSKKEETKAALLCENRVVDQKDRLKGMKRTGKEPYQSKNLVTERNRRIRIKEGLFALRALVPNISKMDRAAILGDAIEYIEDLQKTAKKFQAELREMAEEDYTKNNADLEVPELRGSSEDPLSTRKNQGFPNADQRQQMEVQVEISQIGIREYLLKFIYNQKRGGFLRLMEAIHSLGLQVIDANITTCNGRVLNNLQVVATQEKVELKNLKDSLLTSWTHLS